LLFFDVPKLAGLPGTAIVMAVPLHSGLFLVEARFITEGCAFSAGGHDAGEEGRLAGVEHGGIEIPWSFGVVV
jgi:hypothetical protein